MKFRDTNLQVDEKSSFTHPPSCILPSFSKNTSRLLLPKNLWKCASRISLRKYKRVTCNLPVQLKFLQVNFLHVEDAIESFLEYSFYQVNWNSFVSCDVKLQEHPSFCSCSVFWYVLFYKNLIVLHHGDNNFLFYFDICIKFTLSLIISTMKKWHLTWCVPFYDKNMLERKKTFHHSKIKSF